MASTVLKWARLFGLVGGIMIFAFGVISTIVAFASCKHGPCALSSIASIWAIFVGVLITGVEFGRIGPGPLENNLVRGFVWLILVIFPFWSAWYSWIGSIFVLCSVVLYWVGYAMGYRSSEMFIVTTSTKPVGVEPKPNVSNQTEDLTREPPSEV